MRDLVAGDERRGDLLAPPVDVPAVAGPLELVAQAGRAAVDVVGVGGDVVDQAVADELVRVALDRAAEAPDQRAGGDRGQHPRVHERGQALGPALEGRGAPGGRERGGSRRRCPRAWRWCRALSKCPADGVSGDSTSSHGPPPSASLRSSSSPSSAARVMAISPPVSTSSGSPSSVSAALTCAAPSATCSDVV